MATVHPVWRIRLGQLGPNLQEAAELADVLQEVSAHIQVTGLTRTLTARTSTSSGNPTHLSTKERVRHAVPLSIDAGNVPWSQLVAVVSSAALQEPSSPGTQLQPQVLEVNSGGAVYFLFFKLDPQPPQQQHHHQQQQHHQQHHHQQQQQQRPRQDATRLKHSTTPHQEQQQHLQQIAQQDTAASQQVDAAGASGWTPPHLAQPLQQAAAPAQQQQRQPALTPLLRLHEQRNTAREGVAVLKVGASRLAMQAEQFANELTRHLGIAAPDCRIVRQVGSSAAEWSSVLKAVQHLAEPQQAASQAACSGPDSNTHAPSPADLRQAAAAAAVGSSSGGGGGSSIGCASSSGGGCQVAAELLAELQHLPCFLLMEFVEGCKLSDTVAAVDPAAADVGQLCEDVGRLFLLDMLLGNADRMSCPELGWRGNANNLLYAQPGSRHAGRAVAIDSCVARRPPALKASAEDAAVERLSQLMLAVPGVSLALLQQLLGTLRVKQQRLAQQQQQQRRRQASLPGAFGLCSTLSGVDSLAGRSQSGQVGDAAGSSQLPGSAAGGEASDLAPASCSEQQHSPHHQPSALPAVSPAVAVCFSAAAAFAGKAVVCVTQHRPDSSGLRLPLPVLGQPRACKTSVGGVRAQGGLLQDGTAAGCSAEEAHFTEEEVARFLSGVRQCLDGVLQIKGLLEMVSAKIAEWIAAFVEDVVRLNPALLPTPASPSPGALLRTSKPSPRVSARSSLTSIWLEPSSGAAHGANSGGGSSLGGVFDAVAAAAGGAAGAAAAGVQLHSPGGWSGGGAGGLSGSSFSSRLHAATAASGGGGGGSAGGAGPGRLVLQPLLLQQQRSEAEPPHGVQAAVSSSSNPVPPDGADEAAADTSAAAAAAAGTGQQHAEAGTGSSDGCGGSSSTVAGTPPVSTPPRCGLFKQLVGGSRGAKSQQPLSRRFAAIKAAICSPKHCGDTSSASASRQQRQRDAASSATPDPSDAAGNPCTPPPAGACGINSSGDQQQQQQGSSGTPCSPPSHGPHGPSPSGPGAGARSPLDGSRAPSSDLATAVAAALSPRANALQTEALAGLFGGRSLSAGGRLHGRSSNGAAVQQQQLDKGGHSFGGHSVGGHSSVGVASTGQGSLNSVTEDGREAADAGTPTLPCARRMTWTAPDESPGQQGGVTAAAAAFASGGPSATPPAAAAAAAAAERLALPTGWSSSPSVGLPPAAAAAKLQASKGNSNSSGSKGGGNAAAGNNSSSRISSGSSPLPAVPAVLQPGAGRDVPASGAGVSPGGADSFLHRSHNTRHLSFNSGGGAGGDAASSSSSNSPAGGAAAAAAATAAAAVHSQQQQRSSSSSLQVLASLQLDATLVSITQEARHDGALAERLGFWMKAFREKGGELSAAIASWQERHQLAAVLSTGFLDGSHPIVDAYELGVRLQHMLRRLTALAAGALVQAPIKVLPRVFLGNAVAADSHHLLQHLGVTHVLNAAQELQLTPDGPAHMFAVLRVAIRDEEEEDVATHFQLAREWIDASLCCGGAVLVHCHEGKSRSVTLLLAYLMLSRGLNLAAALAHMRAVHPKASPNAGFMAQLMALDKQLHGSCSIQPSELPRAKPEARVCSICGTPAGVSYESLVRHTKAKHGLHAPPAAAAAAASPAASGGST